MNVIVFASRKGGSGKSTLAAHLATCASKSSRSCLLIDSDPQGSLTLWHAIRGTGEPTLKTANRGIADLVKAAKREGYEWVLVDTPPTKSPVVTEAIRAATLIVIPSRPTVFDLNAVAETINVSRELDKPYAVVINAAPAKREGTESPIVIQAREGLKRLGVPLWPGQITNRTSFSLALAKGQGAREYAEESLAASEIVSLWSAIERSVKAIQGLSEGKSMHRLAA